MEHALEQALTDAGCDNALATRLHSLQAAGDTEACLHLLRCHRCELLAALHEAQRPIDVCDWIIRELEREARVA